MATDNRAGLKPSVSSTPTTTPVTHLTGQDTVQLSKNTSSDAVLTRDSDYQSLETSQSADGTEKTFDQLAITGSDQER